MRCVPPGWCIFTAFKPTHTHPVILFLFSTFIILQIICLAALLFAFSKYSLPPIETIDNPVSVIVCAHDEEENLRELLPLLLAQDHHQFEVIVVEDRCNDNTFDYLREVAANDSRLKMVRIESKPEHVSGKKFALTLGIKAATYNWVLLTDADCRPKGRKWINRMMSKAGDHTHIVLGYSPYEKMPGLLNAFIRFEGLLTAIQYLGMGLLGKPYMGVGRNLAYQKKVFFDNKGFNTHRGITGGDDDLLVNALARSNNTAAIIDPEAIVYSKPKKSWSSFYYQKLRHLSVGKYYKPSDKFILGLFNLSLIGSWLLAVPAIYPANVFPLGLFLLRMALLVVLLHTASRKLGDSMALWKVPLLDFIFVIYYLVTGLSALSVKTIRWKKN